MHVQDRAALIRDSYEKGKQVIEAACLWHAALEGGDDDLMDRAIELLLQAIPAYNQAKRREDS